LPNNNYIKFYPLFAPVCDANVGTVGENNIQYFRETLLGTAAGISTAWRATKRARRPWAVEPVMRVDGATVVGDTLVNGNLTVIN
jgi:hypothetical protein